MNNNNNKQKMNFLIMKKIKYFFNISKFYLNKKILMINVKYHYI